MCFFWTSVQSLGAGKCQWFALLGLHGSMKKRTRDTCYVAAQAYRQTATSGGGMARAQASSKLAELETHVMEEEEEEVFKADAVD